MLTTLEDKDQVEQGGRFIQSLYELAIVFLCGVGQLLQPSSVDGCDHDWCEFRIVLGDVTAVFLAFSILVRVMTDGRIPRFVTEVLLFLCTCTILLLQLSGDPCSTWLVSHGFAVLMLVREVVALIQCCPTPGDEKRI